MTMYIYLALSIILILYLFKLANFRIDNIIFVFFIMFTYTPGFLPFDMIFFDGFAFLFKYIIYISVFIYSLIYRKKLSMNRGYKKYLTIILFLLLIILINIFYTPNFVGGVNLIVFFILNVIVPLTLFALFYPINFSMLNLISKSLIVSAILVSIYILINISNYDVRITTEISSLNNARYISLGIIFITYEIYDKIYMKKIMKAIFLMLTNLFLIQILILTGSRGPLISLILTIIVMSIVFYFKLIYKNIITIKFNHKIIYFTLFIFIIASGLNILIINNSDQRSVNFITSLVSDEILYSKGDRLRFVFYDIGFKNFLSSPINGIGTAGFNLNGSYFIYPHNIFLEFMSDYGIIGLIILFVVLMHSLKYFFISIRKNSEPILIPLSTIWIFGLVNYLFSGSISNNLYFFSLVFLHLNYYKKESDK